MSTKPEKQPAGKFTMNLNYRRKTNENAPAITGRISAPETPDVEFDFNAYLQNGEKGPYWIGPVVTRSLREAALNPSTEQGTNFVAIRTNGFKVMKTLDDGSPNPAYLDLSPEDRAKEDRKPDFWASWTRDPSKGQKEIRASAWERAPSRYGPWASGQTQYPLKAIDGQEADIPFDPDPAPSAAAFEPVMEEAPAAEPARGKRRSQSMSR